MNKQLEALIASEIVDFFAGVVDIHTELGGPNTVEDAQQQLTERVTRIASECEAALIAALELKEEQRATWFRVAQKLGGELDSAEKRITELEAEQLERINAVFLQAKHIETLEDMATHASPLAVKLPGILKTTNMHSSGFNKAVSLCAEAIRAAGGTVSEGE